MPITNTSINSRVNYNPPFNSANYNQILWADIPLNLDISPLTGDLLRIVNVAAVEQSMENIINTYVNERPYNNTLGTSLQLRLFENSTTIETQLIKQAVNLGLVQNEPRITIQNINIITNPNGNSYTLTIQYNINGSITTQIFTMILQRNR